jgi:hypothetical protein
MEWAEDGRAAWVTPSRNDCVVTGGHTGHSGYPERTSLCHRVVSSRARGAECVEGDDEWTTGPGLHSCRGPCGARILHATFLCMHAALQQCGGVGCVFTSPSLRERKGAKVVPLFSSSSRAVLFFSFAFARAGTVEGVLMLPLFALRLWLRHQPHPGTAPYTRHTKARCPAPAQGGDET